MSILVGNYEFVLTIVCEWIRLVNTVGVTRFIESADSFYFDDQDGDHLSLNVTADVSSLKKKNPANIVTDFSTNPHFSKAFIMKMNSISPSTRFELADFILSCQKISPEFSIERFMDLLASVEEPTPDSDERVMALFEVKKKTHFSASPDLNNNFPPCLPNRNAT